MLTIMLQNLQNYRNILIHRDHFPMLFLSDEKQLVVGIVLLSNSVMFLYAACKRCVAIGILGDDS